MGDCCQGRSCCQPWLCPELRTINRRMQLNFAYCKLNFPQRNSSDPQQVAPVKISGTYDYVDQGPSNQDFKFRARKLVVPDTATAGSSSELDSIGLPIYGFLCTKLTKISILRSKLRIMFVNATLIAYTIHYIKFLRSCKFFFIKKTQGKIQGKSKFRKGGKGENRQRWEGDPFKPCGSTAHQSRDKVADQERPAGHLSRADLPVREEFFFF